MTGTPRKPRVVCVCVCVCVCVFTVRGYRAGLHRGITVCVYSAELHRGVYGVCLQCGVTSRGLRGVFTVRGLRGVPV